MSKKIGLPTSRPRKTVETVFMGISLFTGTKLKFGANFGKNNS